MCIPLLAVAVGSGGGGGSCAPGRRAWRWGVKREAVVVPVVLAVFIGVAAVVAVVLGR